MIKKNTIELPLTFEVWQATRRLVVDRQEIADLTGMPLEDQEFGSVIAAYEYDIGWIVITDEVGSGQRFETVVLQDSIMSENLAEVELFLWKEWVKEEHPQLHQTGDAS